MLCLGVSTIDSAINMTIQSTILAALFASRVTAFPQAVTDSQRSEYSSLGQQAAAAIGKPSPKEVTFNAEEQLVDVTGIHEWRAPLPGQDRGPCPGRKSILPSRVLSQ